MFTAFAVDNQWAMQDSFWWAWRMDFAGGNLTLKLLQFYEVGVENADILRIGILTLSKTFCSSFLSLSIVTFHTIRLLKECTIQDVSQWVRLGMVCNWPPRRAEGAICTMMSKTMKTGLKITSVKIHWRTRDFIKQRTVFSQPLAWQFGSSLYT